jgi:hypothetical protein
MSVAACGMALRRRCMKIVSIIEASSTINQRS